jgi:hypothetical protein
LKDETLTTHIHRLFHILIAGTLALPHLAAAEDDVQTLRRDLEIERANLAEARRALEAQWKLLDALQRRIGALEPGALNAITGTGNGGATSAAETPVQTAQSGGVERVGEAPEETTPPPIAVLGDQGGIITKSGQWTLEPSFEYTHADRNRVLFRGIELVESILVGVFDINESREDLLTAALGARFGVTNRFEVGVRVPYIYRADRTVLAPIAGSGNNAQIRDFPANGDGLGDIEATLRYQLTDGQGGWPFLIANFQAVAPTGSSPFGVRRDVSGAPLEAATGSGFWGVSPSLTVILPSDPAVIFASLGYTYNFARNLNTQIGSQQIDYIKPGDAPSLNVGIGVSLNDRLSFNLGYAHTWAFSTKMTTRAVQTTNPLQPTLSAPVDSSSRDLQVGRYLFGVSYRISDKTTFNWTVEIGATAEAPNVHTTVRIPFTF